jgi:hypothetical protein
VSALKQARKGYRAIISKNPTDVTISRKPLVQNPTYPNDPTKKIEDPYSTPTTISMTVRVANEREVVLKNSPSPVGSSTDLTRYLLWSYDDTVLEGDIFTEIQGYRVGRPHPLRTSGKVYGWQAQLIEVE